MHLSFHRRFTRPIGPAGVCPANLNGRCSKCSPASSPPVRPFAAGAFASSFRPLRAVSQVVFRVRALHDFRQAHHAEKAKHSVPCQGNIVEVVRRLHLYLIELEADIEQALPQPTRTRVSRIARFATSVVSAIEFVLLPALRASGHHRFRISAVVAYSQFKRRITDMVVPSSVAEPCSALRRLLRSVRVLSRTCATTMHAPPVDLPSRVEGDLIAEIDAGRRNADPLDTTRARAMVDEAKGVLQLLAPRASVPPKCGRVIRPAQNPESAQRGLRNSVP